MSSSGFRLKVWIAGSLHLMMPSVGSAPVAISQPSGKGKSRTPFNSILAPAASGAELFMVVQDSCCCASSRALPDCRKSRNPSGLGLLRLQGWWCYCRATTRTPSISNTSGDDTDVRPGLVSCYYLLPPLLRRRPATATTTTESVALPQIRAV